MKIIINLYTTFKRINALPHIFYPSKKIEIGPLQMLRPIDQVKQIEITNIVASYDIRIDLAHKISPFLSRIHNNNNYTNEMLPIS